MESPRRFAFSVHYIFTLAGLLILYYVAARLGLMIAFRDTHISPVWPPAGIALGGILIFGLRVWPAISLGAFLANYVTGLSLFTSMTLSFGNTMEALFGAYVITYFCGNSNPLESSRGVLIFILAGISSTIIAALVGTTAIFAGGYSQGTDFAYLLWTWWLGDTVGVFVMAPLLLAWSGTLTGFQRAQTIQAFVLYLILAIVGLMVFSRISPFEIPLTYLTVPPVVVAAFRYKQKGASTAIDRYGTVHDYHPKKCTRCCQDENCN